MMVFVVFVVVVVGICGKTVFNKTQIIYLIFTRISYEKYNNYMRIHGTDDTKILAQKYNKNNISHFLIIFCTY